MSDREVKELPLDDAVRYCEDYIRRHTHADGGVDSWIDAPLESMKVLVEYAKAAEQSKHEGGDANDTVLPMRAEVQSSRRNVGEPGEGVPAHPTVQAKREVTDEMVERALEMFYRDWGQEHPIFYPQDYSNDARALLCKIMRAALEAALSGSV